ncbi:phosphate ABC transporter permease PstA [Pseudovibrio sp. SPO723]|nr:phosphate ABC transporter permease PstA [Pseudovibrio sp. SPO723]MDX5593142.1 phosphate ABC transporter permease PstA [Pseudovibrio sp. SPO723]
MTSLAQQNTASSRVGIHTSDEARKRLKARYGTEARFKAYGLSAILVAAAFLVLLLTTIVSQGIPAFYYNYVTLDLNLTEEEVDPSNPGSASYNTIIRDGLKEAVPFATSRTDRRVLYGLVSSGANIILRNEVLDDPSILGSKGPVQVPLSDFADLYAKGLVTEINTKETTGTATVSGTEGTISVTSDDGDFDFIRDQLRAYLESQLAAVQRDLTLRGTSEDSLNARISGLQEQMADADELVRQRLENEISATEDMKSRLQVAIQGIEADLAELQGRLNSLEQRQVLSSRLPSFLINVNGGTAKVTAIDATSVEAEVLVPFSIAGTIPAGEWTIDEIETPEALRKFNDQEIAYTDYLLEQGAITSSVNSIFFSAGASREPEMAGIWGAVVGSFWTMVVTLALSFPIGVAAAIYLEEFAPKNRWTHLIEVNINNLAAVPSIVFGLLGLAVFLNAFGLPRSAPIVGGMVLALMTLPTIIIASRAALKAVPPSIREAALGVGASRLQAVLHHVLPLAMPGIFTGTIIGMAQALGETAPLLMIGMVAFIVDIPGGPVDPSTVLPVQIFMWADFPEPAFQQKTSAAIMVLLGFLITMNAIAIVLRKRFERRW